MEINKELSDFFESEKVSLIQYPDSGTLNFNHLDKFVEFVRIERDFWAQYQSATACREIHMFFYTNFDQLYSALQPNLDITRAKKLISQVIQALKRNSFPGIYSTTATAIFIKNLFLKNPQIADAACVYMFKNRAINPSNINSLEGVIYALIFTGEIHNVFNEEVESNRQSLEQLKNAFISELNELHSDFDIKSKNIEDSITKYRNEINDWKESIQQKADSLLVDKQTSLNELENSYKSSKDTMEKLYSELLRLKEPAQYWNEFSTNYKTQGDRWRWWSVGLSIMFIIFLTILLYNLPEKYLGEKGFTFDSFKITIIITLIISIAIYLIRLFIKLSISAYHLSRDAKERYQLTYVFLSLLKERGVSESERHIVLQSLFSRADTGLLKGDHSPTIPDGIWSNIFKNIAK